MKFIFLFFIVYLTNTELVTNKTVEIYYDTLGEAYINYEKGYINRIVNEEQFPLSSGYGRVTFEINNHNIKLLEYKPKAQNSVQRSEDCYSPMFIKTIYIGIFRGANRKDPSKCSSIEKAKEYIRYTELSMRLWSGNQIRIAQNDDDLYISSSCLVIDENTYVKANIGEINNSLYNEAKKNDTIPDIAVKWFITDDFPGYWMGLATVGSPTLVTTRSSNVWLTCKYNPSEEDPNNKKLQILIHQFGHNCGFHHAARQDQPSTGTFTTFKIVENEDDCANIMSNCGNWYNPINVYQYYYTIVGKKPEPWLFKDIEVGIHKYRIYAIDHPYTRHYLGTNKAFHEDSEVIDGIPFKYNCISIKIPVNVNLTSKYAGDIDTSEPIILEYRGNTKGQEGAKDFGIRIIYGNTQKSNLFMANSDGLKSWKDSEIPLGVDYYPCDFDVGSLRIRITKIHKGILKEILEEEIIKEDVRNYDESSYAELEIEFNPNIKPIIPSPPSGLPSLKFSPSFFNCHKNGEKGYICSKSSTSSGWYYFINDGNRNKSVPRVYVGRNVIGRNILRSYNGGDSSYSDLCYGDDGGKCISISVTNEFYESTVKVYQNANVTIDISDHVVQSEEFKNVNLIYGNIVDISEDSFSSFITDLFGNKKDITIINNTFAMIFPSLEIDGFAEGAVVIESQYNQIEHYKSFTIYNPVNANRVAFGYNDENEIELSPAVIPGDGYYSTTTMLFSKSLKADEWYYYPILYLSEKDYVLIDFKGMIPTNLIMTIESDMGEYIKELNDLSGYVNISYKLTYREVNKYTGGWCEIDRIKFNQEIEIQNIRPVYRNAIGNQMMDVDGKKDSFNYNGYRYSVESPKVEKYYIYNKVKIEIDSREYSFDTPTTVIKLNELPSSASSDYDTSSPTDSNDSDDSSDAKVIIIGVAVGGVVVVLLVVCLVVYLLCRFKNANKKQGKETAL